MSDEDEPIDLEKVREADALLDEAEEMREEAGRETRQIHDQELKGIMAQKETYTVREAAELTGYHPESIRRHIRNDRLNAAQTGQGNYRISRPELARWWRDELGGGELFDDTDAESKTERFIGKLKAEREAGGTDWVPTAEQVERLAELCARETFEHYQSLSRVRWRDNAPKSDDWDAFQEAFGDSVGHEDELADLFVEIYEQVIDDIIESASQDSEG